MLGRGDANDGAGGADAPRKHLTEFDETTDPGRCASSAQNCERRQLDIQRRFSVAADVANQLEPWVQADAGIDEPPGREVDAIGRILQV